MLDLNINPETLRDETDEEALGRRHQTRYIGNGHSVACHPVIEDPSIVESKHRGVCLLKPYAACSICVHSKFTLVFNANQTNVNLEQIKCPKWENNFPVKSGELPTHYVSMEIGTCLEKPFPFCGSCPSRDKLSKMYIDKNKEGWYSRFKRFNKEEEDG